MAKKIVIGMLAVFAVIVIASAGYKFGQSLADNESLSTDVRDAETR
jgi:hypothetical protein